MNNRRRAARILSAFSWVAWLSAVPLVWTGALPTEVATFGATTVMLISKTVAHRLRRGAVLAEVSSGSPSPR